MAYMRQFGQFGLSDYQETYAPVDPGLARWDWMFYPPPYDFLDHNITPPSPFVAPAQSMGLGWTPGGSCCSGCASGGSCCGGHDHGMGAVDMSLTGTGLLGQFGLAIPNWVVYGGVAAVVLAPMLLKKHSRRRRSRAAIRRLQEAA